MQLICLPTLPPISFLDNEVLQRSLRPPCRKEGGRERAVVLWFYLLVLKDVPAVSEILGGAIAALSTWKTYQQGLINAKVKASGFCLCLFFYYQEKKSYTMEAPCCCLADKAFAILTCELGLLPWWRWDVIPCRVSICFWSYLNMNSPHLLKSCLWLRKDNSREKVKVK